MARDDAEFELPTGGLERRRTPSMVTGPIGVLGIQGSFALHMRSLHQLGIASRLVRKPEDLEGLRGLILPGGESTVMSRLMRKYELFDPVRELGREGMPMFGTCAGAILLGHGEGSPVRLELVPVELERNSYGTQIDSFTAGLDLEPFDRPFHGIFIRAPRIVSLDARADATASRPNETPVRRVIGGDPAVLAQHDGSPVLVSWKHFLLATFHPELTDDLRLHRYFVERFVKSRRELSAV